MRKIERLRKEALESCKFRGHKMERFEYSSNKHWALAACQICSKHVSICLFPLPNEIEIGGEAVALGCED